MLFREDKDSVIDSENVRKLFYYDSETGDLFWKERPAEMFKRPSSAKSWNTKYAGKKITTLDGKGYLCMTLFGKRYLAHRIIWLYEYGGWPENIDHINGDKLDNRLCNLRSVTTQQNNMNSRMLSNNTSGVTGVYLNKKNGLWCAQIKFKGHTRHLGSSRDFEEAVRLRRAEEERLGFTKRHGKNA